MLKPKYFLYARKSTEDDDHQIMSIEAQLFELREYARRENLEIIREFQEAKSAKKPRRERFAEMIDEIEKREGVGILAWHPDRLARNSVDGGRIIYLVDTGKIVSLRFPQFWFEPTPQGKFMLQVAFGQSKYFSDNLVENVKRGIRQKLRRGEWLTIAPFGYVNNPKTRQIEPHPAKSKIVARAFEEFAKGTHTLKSMAELGVETKSETSQIQTEAQFPFYRTTHLWRVWLGNHRAMGKRAWRVISLLSLHQEKGKLRSKIFTRGFARFAIK